ncbi:hypothetical protein F4804DRAFT_322442 [Jackrogersella minutella]|nr:hypothetical protein F4804DRAFT_322442 [Jackrogersella minutella]
MSRQFSRSSSTEEPFYLQKWDSALQTSLANERAKHEDSMKAQARPDKKPSKINNLSSSSAKLTPGEGKDEINRHESIAREGSQKLHRKVSSKMSMKFKNFFGKEATNPVDEKMPATVENPTVEPSIASPSDSREHAKAQETQKTDRADLSRDSNPRPVARGVAQDDAGNLGEKNKAAFTPHHTPHRVSDQGTQPKTTTLSDLDDFFGPQSAAGVHRRGYSSPPSTRDVLNYRQNENLPTLLSLKRNKGQDLEKLYDDFPGGKYWVPGQVGPYNDGVNSLVKAHYTPSLQAFQSIKPETVVQHDEVIKKLKEVDDTTRHAAGPGALEASLGASYLQQFEPQGAEDVNPWEAREDRDAEPRDSQGEAEAQHESAKNRNDDYDLEQPRSAAKENGKRIESKTIMPSSKGQGNLPALQRSHRAAHRSSRHKIKIPKRGGGGRGGASNILPHFDELDNLIRAYVDHTRTGDPQFQPDPSFSPELTRYMESSSEFVRDFGNDPFVSPTPNTPAITQEQLKDLKKRLAGYKINDLNLSPGAHLAMIPSPLNIRRQRKNAEDVQPTGTPKNGGWPPRRSYGSKSSILESVPDSVEGAVDYNSAELTPGKVNDSLNKMIDTSMQLFERMDKLSERVDGAERALIRMFDALKTLVDTHNAKAEADMEARSDKA